ncbi:MAG TPA: helix-turn-helix domain-containing protein [Acidimicrobiales bacterium]|nr:helix-turn-helix domain-containing protein [Acidimicrobiales bacterium]
MEPPPVAPLPAVLSTQEVAELLRMSTRSVLEMVRAGTLPARRAPGRRRYHFLAEDVLAAVSHRPVAAGAVEAPRPALDPCEVWGAAPPRDGAAWPRRCLERWVELAAAAGLVAAPDDAGVVSDPRGVAVVDVDGLAYEVLAGPRQRVRCVGEEGEPAWVLIDSVWVEPRP